MEEGWKYWPNQKVDPYYTFTVIITFLFDYCVAAGVYVLMVL